MAFALAANAAAVVALFLLNLECVHWTIGMPPGRYRGTVVHLHCQRQRGARDD